MSEAEDRYLVEMSEDCEGVLGRGVEFLGLTLERGDDLVRLVARYRFEDREWQSAGTGETVVAAHPVLRARLLFDRIRLGFTTLAERV